MAKIDICSSKEIPLGERKLVKVGRQTIGIFNVNGRYCAIKNSCIHDQAPVCLGEVNGTYIPSDFGEYVWGMEGQVLRCPWHGWEFDLLTGRSLFDPETKLTTYPITVENGRIVVEIGGKRNV